MADANAERLDLRDQQRCDERAWNGAHTTDHDHDERIPNGVQIKRQVGRHSRPLQRTTQASEKCPHEKHPGKKPCLVDTERAEHLTILRRRAHQRAPTCTRECVPQQEQHQRTDHDQRDIVGGQRMAEQRDRTGQMRRTRSEQILRTPDPQRGITENQHQREGGKQMEQLGRLINPPQHDDFNQRAQHRDEQRSGQHRQPEAARAVTITTRNAVRHIDAEHIERAVRKVDDARHAEDQR